MRSKLNDGKQAPNTPQPAQLLVEGRGIDEFSHILFQRLIGGGIGNALAQVPAKSFPLVGQGKLFLILDETDSLIKLGADVSVRVCSIKNVSFKGIP